MLQVPITGAAQRQPIPLGNIVTLRRSDPVPAEIVHTNLRATIDLTMNVSGRDLGHVAEDVAQALAGHGVPQDDGSWAPFDPSREDGTLLKASRIRLLGEYARMQEVFRFLGVGLLMASVLVYFLMAPLFRSWVVPLVIMSAAPLGLVGVVLVLLVTKTSLNVQSLLGVIFMVAIVVSNTVLMIDFAQGLRRREGLTPTEAIQKAARIRVRPVLMTALAAFFALLPMAIGAAHGSEANAPLGRSVLGGLVAGVLTTLLVVPCLYSLLLPNAPGMPPTGDQVDPIVDE
jgi:multidrug efflux pump subunit AcrB